MSGSNSVVECNLAKVEVAGSNPVSRSILYLPVEYSKYSNWDTKRKYKSIEFYVSPELSCKLVN